LFTHDQVTLRPLEPEDVDTAYAWHLDTEIEILSGWGPRRSKHAFGRSFLSFIEEPPRDLLVFGIEASGQLVGRIDLALIDRQNQHAMLGLFLGDKGAWGRGIATAATRIMLDYAFTVENLARVYAHVYPFNARAQRLMERVGMQKEGVLRAHEVHHGARRDLVVFGILKEEFYPTYPTLFPIPKR
jgi:RimJ/RimL family protein N-acetyltransferase